MEPYEPHLAIATALAVGLLIGLERERSHPEGSKDAGFAGVRTYPIIALVGALATMFEPLWLPLVALAGVIALVAVSYANDLRKGRDHGATTEVSVLATYLLGALAASHTIEPMTTRFLLVATAAVAITFLLSAKTWLHDLAAKVSREDMFATAKFLIVAVIVLPVLPRTPMGPLDAIVPFTVGLMVVTISGLSFVGYVAMRMLGRRGALLGAALGGLVSSTAVTVSFSRRAKEHAPLVAIAACAIAIASSIMFIRMVVLTALVNPGLDRILAFPAAGGVVGAALAGVLVYRRGSTGDLDSTVKNPFELGTAIRFGLVFAAILLATKAAKVYLGNRGVYLAAALGGTTDVDAVTLSTAQLPDLAPHAAAFAIVIGAASNTIVKSTLAWVLGGRALGMRALLVGGCIIAGLGAGFAASLAM